MKQRNNNVALVIAVCLFSLGAIGAVINLLVTHDVSSWILIAIGAVGNSMAFLLFRRAKRSTFGMKNR